MLSLLYSCTVQCIMVPFRRSDVTLWTWHQRLCQGSWKPTRDGPTSYRGVMLLSCSLHWELLNSLPKYQSLRNTFNAFKDGVGAKQQKEWMYWFGDFSHVFGNVKHCYLPHLILHFDIQIHSKWAWLEWACWTGRQDLLQVNGRCNVTHPMLFYAEYLYTFRH